MVPEISPTSLQPLLAGEDAPLLLDVRETWELRLAAVTGVLNIPMAQIPDRLEELGRDQKIVVMCHTGARSYQVAAFLKQSGFESVMNLAGGIAAWSREVDPTVPEY
ncbi:MAG: sulfurtransferase [Gammaproteobacteria bacterium]|jgi:rhodanese-related sulfurtransferase|nr:MAG: sulfurtransferase [Gammaproteobacteria bacterium]